MSLRILLTGGSGFLGKIILQNAPENCVFTALGRSASNQISCDLSVEIPNFQNMEFDHVFHAAGLAHIVPKTAEQESNFFKQNLEATEHLLKGLESLSKLPKTFVFVSSVAVYGLESGENIDETQPTNPTTPYGKSKLEAEKLIQSWCKQHSVGCLILRLPLIVGENAPGNLGAMEKAIRKGYYFRLGSGSARRSMVNAIDIARNLPKLLGAQGIYHLSDGLQRSYAEMDTWLAEKNGKSIKKIPVWMGKLIAKVGDILPGFPLNSYRLQKLEQSLTFSDIKARTELNWLE